MQSDLTSEMCRKYEEYYDGLITEEEFKRKRIRTEHGKT